MKWIAGFVTLFVISASLLVLGQSAAPVDAAQKTTRHDREFWRAIPKNKFAVPEGQPIFALMQELSGYLGSTDPVLRDDLAYTIISVWLKYQKQISTDELDTLLDEWRANLRVGIGESGTDSVLKRSFSALCLASLAERDLKSPFLGEERYRALLADALAYLKDERDLRGFDPALGWIHATAHTADLLSALASNPLFRVEDQERLLEAIPARLSSAHDIFTYGEQDRLALIAARIAARKDFDPAGFNKWLTAVDASDQRVWSDSPPQLALLHAFENDTYMLRGLAVYLCMTPATPAVTESQSEVLRTLQKR